MTSASLILTTYNQPRYLSLVLQSLHCQTAINFEVVIADDGSTDQTRQVIDEFLALRPPFSIKHFWQPHQGFRVGEARNGAIQMAESDWLIFVDGDMILHPRFVESHLQKAGDKRVLFGGRVKLTQAFSGKLESREIPIDGIESLLRSVFNPYRERWYASVSDGPLDALSGFLMQHCGGRYRPLKKDWMNALSIVLPRSMFFRLCFKTGSNFSASKRLVEVVNGFDRHFNNLSGEDGELFWRLLHAGAQPRSVLFTAIAYHLWHKDNWERSGEKRAQALAMQQDTRLTRKVSCDEGLR